MDVLQSAPIDPGRPGGLADSNWRPILLGAVAALVVSGTVVTMVGAIGTTVAQVTAVAATATAASATRNASDHSRLSCGLASR